MRVNVGHDQFLVHGGIGALQVRVAGIVIDDHLVDAAQAIVVLLGHALIFHAEAPMGVTNGESTVRGDMVDLVVVEHFENGFEEVEAIGGGRGADLVIGRRQVRGEIRRSASNGGEHGPGSVFKLWTELPRLVAALWGMQSGLFIYIRVAKGLAVENVGRNTFANASGQLSQWRI